MSYYEGCERCGDREPGAVWLGLSSGDEWDALCSPCYFEVVEIHGKEDDDDSDG